MEDNDVLNYISLFSLMPMLLPLDNISHPISYATEVASKHDQVFHFVAVTPASEQSWLHLLLMSLHFNMKGCGYS